MTKTKKIFSKKHYSSGDGMLTSVWGPSMWHVLHTISFNYPNTPSTEEKQNYMNFIKSLRHVLPCMYCRINFKNNLKSLPLTMDNMKNRETFSKYIYNLHEVVNKMLNKKSGLTYCKVRETYEHFRARCTNETDKKVFNIKKINKTVKKQHKKKEKGCTEPLYGKKAKCVLNIVPVTERIQTFKVDKRCFKHRKSLKK
jgi:hypothetical protein